VSSPSFWYIAKPELPGGDAAKDGKGGKGKGGKGKAG
jgi:hypothetical protein